jgi:hypothetical protein
MPTTYEGLTQAEIDEKMLAAMGASLERAEMARAYWNSMFKELDRRGCGADYALIDRLQRLIKEATGVTAEDEKLLAEADQLRSMRSVVKAELAAQQASLESTMPEGYQSIGTDATPVFIQLPVELNVTTPAPVTHVHVPEQKPTKRSSAAESINTANRQSRSRRHRPPTTQPGVLGLSRPTPD